MKSILLRDNQRSDIEESFQIAVTYSRLESAPPTTSARARQVNGSQTQYNLSIEGKSNKMRNSQLHYIEKGPFSIMIIK